MPKSVIVRLTDADVSKAIQVGGWRQIYNARRGSGSRYGANEKKSWEINMLGAFGECGTAIYVNLPWDGGKLGNYDERDVGGMIDVRAISQRWYRLVLHKPPQPGMRGDPPNVPYVNAWPNLRDSTVELSGWLYAREGQLEKYWEDPSHEGRPAYFINQGLLRPMPQLLDWVMLNSEVAA